MTTIQSQITWRQPYAVSKWLTTAMACKFLPRIHSYLIQLVKISGGKWSPVSTSWRVLGSRMGEQCPDTNILRWAVVDSRQGVVLQPGSRATYEHLLTVKPYDITKDFKRPRTWTDYLVRCKQYTATWDFITNVRAGSLWVARRLASHRLWLVCGRVGGTREATVRAGNCTSVYGKYGSSRSGIGRHGLDWCGSGYGCMSDACDCSNGPSGSKQKRNL